MSDEEDSSSGVSGVEQRKRRLAEPDLDVTEEDDKRTKIWIILFGTAAGNSMEWLDFALYAVFSEEIGKAFFPPAEGNEQMLEALALFGSAFLMRPLGGLLFGHLGDKYGRVYALRMSIIMMAVPTAIVTFLPTYERVGWWAPAILIIVRLFQGLSVGGEWIGSMVYIYESAPEGKKTFFLSLNQALECGYLVAVAITALFVAFMDPVTLSQWGWRLPFLSGVILGSFALVARTYWHDPPEYIEAMDAIRRSSASSGARFVSSSPSSSSSAIASSSVIYASSADNDQKEVTTTGPTHLQKVWDIIRRQTFLLILLGMGYAYGFTYFYFAHVWLLVYLKDIRKPPLQGVFGIYVAAVAMSKFGVVFWGWLAERVGVRTLMIPAIVLGTALATPAMTVFQSGSLGAVFFMQLCVGLVGGMYWAVAAAWGLGRLPDISTRYTAFGIPYNISGAIFGSTTPLLATALASAGPDWFAGLLLISPAFFSLCAILAVGQDSPDDIQAREGAARSWNPARSNGYSAVPTTEVND